MKIRIDTTISKQALVTLLNEGKEVASKNGTDALLLCNELLKENNLNLSEVEFELKNEPGSYTGLKVGASLVNTLNYANGSEQIVIPLYQIDPK